MSVNYSIHLVVGITTTIDELLNHMRYRVDNLCDDLKTIIDESDEVRALGELDDEEVVFEKVREVIESRDLVIVDSPMDSDEIAIGDDGLDHAVDVYVAVDRMEFSIQDLTSYMHDAGKAMEALGLEKLCLRLDEETQIYREIKLHVVPRYA